MQRKAPSNALVLLFFTHSVQEPPASQTNSESISFTFIYFRFNTACWVYLSLHYDSYSSAMFMHKKSLEFIQIFGLSMWREDIAESLSILLCFANWGHVSQCFHRVHHREEASAYLWGFEIICFDLIPTKVKLLCKFCNVVLQVNVVFMWQRNHMFSYCAVHLLPCLCVYVLVHQLYHVHITCRMGRNVISAV